MVYRAVFLTGFFAFFRLSNLAPHSLSSFDPSRHLTGHDVFFTKKISKLLIKWSKTPVSLLFIKDINDASHNTEVNTNTKKLINN